MKNSSIKHLTNSETFLIYAGSNPNCECNETENKKACNRKCEQLSNFMKQYEETGVLPPHSPTIVTKYTVYPSDNHTDVTIEFHT